MFWIFATLIALASALLICLPLTRRRTGQVVAEGPNDAEVYRDQLVEIERDEKLGLVDGQGAAQARAEIARRLIAATRDAEKRKIASANSATIAITVILCFIVPLAGLAFYGRLGLPEVGDYPLRARFDAANPDPNILIRRVELQLESRPEDGRGWEVLAPVYLANNRVEEAVNAWRNAIRYLGPDARRFGGLAEALVVLNKGKMTAETRDAFARVLALVPDDPRARFYLALADAEDGNFDGAIGKLEALKKDSDPQAPWIKVTDDQIARIRSQKESQAKAPGSPTVDDVEAAAQLSDADRSEMIRTMVEGLDSRLKADPDNIEGWKRLIRSYVMLQQPERAAEALKSGLTAFPADTENGKSLMALAAELGLGGENRTP